MATNNAANIGTSATGTVLQGAGVGTASTFSTATYPSTATGTGTILRADGTNWVATTATYPATTTANQLLYSSATSVVGGLATANSGVLTTSSAGVPSIDTTNFAVLTTGVQMKGNNTNTAPPAGFIGERISTYQSSPQSLTNNTALTIASINLTAGIWDISTNFQYLSNTTTVTTQVITSISTTTNSVNSDYGDGSTLRGFAAAGVTNNSLAYSIPAFRVTLSGNTTYYLTAKALFTTSTATGNGRISAVRVG